MCCGGLVTTVLKACPTQGCRKHVDFLGPWGQHLNVWDPLLGPAMCCFSRIRACRLLSRLAFWVFNCWRNGGFINIGSLSEIVGVSDMQVSEMKEQEMDSGIIEPAPIQSTSELQGHLILRKQKAELTERCVRVDSPLATSTDFGINSRRMK